jgi:hypothetical protein
MIPNLAIATALVGCSHNFVGALKNAQINVRCILSLWKWPTQLRKIKTENVILPVHREKAYF